MLCRRDQLVVGSARMAMRRPVRFCCRDENMELRLCHSEKLAVAQLRPAELECRAYFMAVETVAQRRRNTLIEKDAH